MPKKYIPKAITDELTKLANGCCEYCKYLQFYALRQFSNDHIIPSSLGGTDELNNLARACESCNGYKFTAVSALDLVTNQVVPLFHPRKNTWQNHFRWSEDFLKIEGLTPTGRATIIRLKMNQERIVNFRGIAIGNGHPPE